MPSVYILLLLLLLFGEEVCEVLSPASQSVGITGLHHHTQLP